MSVKKPGKKLTKNTRNILAVRKDKFWPVLDDASSFTDLLEENLKHVRTIHPKFPWSEMKKMTKEERKQKVNDFFQNLPQDSLEAHKKAMDLRKDLSIGVNDVSRALEKKELACCLLSGEAKPKLLVSHVVDLSKSAKVPVLVLNFLKEKTMECLGFSALAIGFKKEVMNNPTHEMYKLSKEIIRLFNEKYGSEFDGNIEDEILLKTSKTNVSYGCNIPEEKYSSLPSLQLDLNDIYLYRESTSYRVFRPNGINCSETENTDSNIKMESINDVNSLESDSDDGVNLPTKKVRYYELPTILRVQSNPLKSKKQKKKKK